MPSFNPFHSGKGRPSYTLFEIRLDNDFVVFRGSEDEAAGHLLRGVVVLCLSAPLKVEEIRLRLTGTLRMSWTETKTPASDLCTQKVDKTTTLLSHNWPAFVGGGTPGSASKSITLPQGNYEWPFELMLPGDTCESIEGMSEANLTYKLRATVTRGVLAHDLHAYKLLRVIRTLEPSALEFLHAMSIENIWPNKVEYSVVVPQKAVVFGTSIPLEARFTPLLKGLELGNISVKLCEVRDITAQSSTGQGNRSYKKERQVATWVLKPSQEEHWQDVIGDTGQEGWVMSTALDLPKKLGKCMQDVSVYGVKIRHKLKLVVALKNPDGHVSELRATLPVSIFISPNMPIDDDGNLVRSSPLQARSDEPSMGAPPVYGEHVLDQLYDNVEPSGLQTPVASGANTPYYTHSRVGSSEDLVSMASGLPIPPAALSSRLQNMPLDRASRHISLSLQSDLSGSGRASPPDGDHSEAGGSTALPHSPPLTRHNSDSSYAGAQTPEHVDYPDIAELSKVPSYQTAVRTPARPLPSGLGGGSVLPDYRTAMSAPSTPTLENTPAANPLDMIREASHESRQRSGSSSSSSIRGSSNAAQRPGIGRRQTYSFLPSSHRQGGHAEERLRVQLVQARARVF